MAHQPWDDGIPEGGRVIKPYSHEKLLAAMMQDEEVFELAKLEVQGYLQFEARQGQTTNNVKAHVARSLMRRISAALDARVEELWKKYREM